VGLRPDTTYHYRLVADNERENGKTMEGGRETGDEGIFTTSVSAVPQAVTGTSGRVGTTSATVSGTVDPDGQPATYTFELGVYAGTGTQYGIVYSGSTGVEVVPTVETLGLSGLQPGTTYAYRIKLTSGYGAATGESVLFTTEGVPVVLSPPPLLAQLPLPKIVFPKPSVSQKAKKVSLKKKSKKAKRKITGRLKKDAKQKK
jgi:uncharacterized protein YraI